VTHGPIRIVREMGATPAELLRGLPAVLAPWRFEVRGGEVHAEAGGGQLRIGFRPQGDRGLGALRLPVTRVELTFSGFTAEEASEVLARFDRQFQRGGG
jgi:hypothetical protein